MPIDFRNTTAYLKFYSRHAHWDFIELTDMTNISEREQENGGYKHTDLDGGHFWHTLVYDQGGSLQGS